MTSKIWNIQLLLQQGSFQLELSCQSHARVLGLFGPSGSGKTTCLEAIAGLRRNATGTLRCGDDVWLDSASNRCLKAEQRGIGYVPQDHLLFPHLNAEQNLRYGMPRVAGAETHFNTVVEVLDLGHLLEHHPHQLSGGQAQRVALGRALCAQPRMLMLDEPLAALDAELRRRILPFLIEVRDRFNIPMLVVSHNPLELQALCDEVIALKDGSQTHQGTPLEVFTALEANRDDNPSGFENILQASVIQHDTHSTQIQLTTDATLTIPRHTSAPISQRLLIGIPSRDILVALTPIKGISARNTLIVRIDQIDTHCDHVLLRTTLTTPEAIPIVAELTPDACHELHLEPGQQVYLIIKSTSISVHS